MKTIRRSCREELRYLNKLSTATGSRAMPWLHGIDEAFWYRHRPEVLAIVQRLRRDGHPDPKVMARITPRPYDKPV